MSIIICAGDSITYGLWAKSERWSEKLRIWLEDRSLQLGKQELNTGNYVAVYNLGIPGDTSAGLLDRFEKEVFPRVNSEQEMTVIIAIGTNDARFIKPVNRFEIGLEETVANIRSLIQISRKFAKKILILGLPPVDEARTRPIYWDLNYSYSNEDLGRYNNAIAALAKGENLPFVDLFAFMIQMNVPDLMEDGIHPNTKGQAVMFELIRKSLVENSFL